MKINLLLQRLTKNKQFNSTMKKLLTLIVAGGVMAFYACGPSKEDLAKAEKHKQDSIHAADSVAKAQADAAAAEQRMKDSIANVQAMEKAKADSTRMADSLAAAKKGGKPKTKKEAEKQEVKKVVSGRG